MGETPRLSKILGETPCLSDPRGDSGETPNGFAVLGETPMFTPHPGIRWVDRDDHFVSETDEAGENTPQSARDRPS